MIRKTVSVLIASICLAQIASAAEPATKPAVPETFIRFVDDDSGGGRLESAEVALQNADGVTVHLIAAVHIGEKSYYDSLNQEFRGFDAVLYEMVKPRDMAPPKPGEPIQSDSSVTQFQHLLRDVLELDFQLDDIDYSAPNFVHADLDRETFEKMQEERGESFESLMLQQMMHAMTDPAQADNNSDAQQIADMIHIIARPDMERQIKVVIARQLGQMDSTAMGLDGPQGTVILTERNKAALKTLDDTIAGGKKNIAIFYGAAHMPNMAKTLQEKGFTPVSLDWHLAWDLKIRADQPSAIEKVFDSLFQSAATTKPAPSPSNPQ